MVMGEMSERQTRGRAASKCEHSGVRMSEHHTAMHAASHNGDAFSEDALTSALKHDRLICYKWGGLYRRLLYFANLLLCSAAILKRSKETARGG